MSQVWVRVTKLQPVPVPAGTHENENDVLANYVT